LVQIRQGSVDAVGRKVVGDVLGIGNAEPKDVMNDDNTQLAERNRKNELCATLASKYLPSAVAK
jgi:hypothetical protein